MTRRSLTILHLENDPRDAELVARRLRADGVEAILEVVRTRAAFVAALARQPFDVVIADHQLADFSGLEALSLTRERRAGLPFVFCTATMGEEAAVEAMRRGAFDCVLKSQLGALAPALRRAVAVAAEHRARLAAEQRLRESEERFRLLAEHAEFGLWISNADGSELDYVNPAFERIWGRSAEHLCRRPASWLEGVVPEDRARVSGAFDLWLAGERPVYEEEFRVARPDGTERVVIDTVVATIDREDGRRTLSGIVRDVTERRAAERHAARAQRLESIGTLAGGIAHDLNNTLAPILIAAEMLRGELAPGAAEQVAMIEASARRGAELVRQLLTFARGAEGERLEVDPAALVEEVVRIVRATFPKNIAVSTPPPGAPLPAIVGDRTQLHQALLNLCVNSRDAMPAGGMLWMELAEVAATPDGAHPDREERGGGWLRLRVRDSGEGIPAAILDRVFDPFFTTKGPEQGTGLGLSTTLGIVKSHAGFVRIDSALGRGTTVDLYLPAAGAEPAVRRQSAGAERTANGGGELVLVIDDEAMIRHMMRALLDRLGYRPLVASGGTEAMAAVAEHGAAIRWVICDLQMPGLDGVTLLRALVPKLPAARLVVMSGVFDDERNAELTQLGVRRRLEKPFDRAGLLDALRLDEA